MLKSIANKLKRSKSVPVSEDQIRKHRDQRRQRDEWRAELDALQSVTDRLRTDYARHKGDFALGRYEELKTMVKMAVEGLSAVTSENKTRRQTAPVTSDRHAMTGLKDQAEQFSRIQDKVAANEQLYAQMTPAQIEADTETLRREVIQLKRDFRSEKEKLERLAAAYQNSKQLNPAQRYPVLKDMIKEATATPPSAAASR